MLEFVDYSIENLKKYMPLIQRSPFLCCDISLGAFLMWDSKCNLQFAVYNNTIIAKQDLGDEQAFSYPYGDDVDGAIDELIEYAKENDLPILFYCLDEEHLEKIKKDGRFKSVHANYERRWSDYLYSFEEMESLKGKKFSGQRNHINKFKKNYGQPDFWPISPEDIEDIKVFLKDYHKEHGGGAIEEMEYEANFELVDNFEDLGMYGGILRVEDKIVGFTIGEMMGDTLMIHVEKALKKYDGIYPTLFNSFMKYMKELGVSVKLVNREDDSGDMGLRTSKSQYHPIRLIHKYLVRLNSPVNGIPQLAFEGGLLNAINEKDKANYFALCTDKENNRYWGYDYEEDYTVTEINEDVFFEAQKFDNSLGYSVNFAVRKDEYSDLIGETIVYHFTSKDYAEIGGRIAKEWQGRGFGTKSFTATADFAEKQLGVKVRAKCFKENIPSYHMITASGFGKTGEDDTFYYFER